MTKTNMSKARRVGSMTKSASTNMAYATATRAPGAAALIARAMKRYRQECVRDGFVAQQPSAYASEVEADHVVLRNVRGELARYRVSAAGRLLRVRVEP